ncbi:TRAP transporter substrate-binding protein [Mycobacterium dioxanotrophicus]|uniref:TRAP transporter substrate-binding protein n=1 Tax=Mycobacterium dioxanotrophicus TaxID=482462 RepID=A0A1Y0CAI1_9MYCO|nr:TAXI family TRAP transporter solute-binding subunit [Mycobacterium dioxanotrophicus]ART72260.1 TRAP transporter substrate-binding protein [Mycobacterium dioxanotrophicus]
MTAAMTRRAFAIGAASLLAAGCMRNGPTARVRLAAGESGGLYLAFAELLAERMHARYPHLQVDVIATEGSVDNLARLRSGEADMGLALADVAEHDLAGGPRDTAPQALARVYENYLQVVVRDAAAAQRLSDLKGGRVSIGPGGSGAAATSVVMLDAAGLRNRVALVNYRLRDGLTGLANGDLQAVVWSGGVPTPAITDLDARQPLRMLDIGNLATPMTGLSGYPYLLRSVPTGTYAPPGLKTIGVPNLLLIGDAVADAVAAAAVDVLASDAAQLVPAHVRGLQYLAPATMIQTGLVPLHPGAAQAYRRLHG